MTSVEHEKNKRIIIDKCMSIVDQIGPQSIDLYEDALHIVMSFDDVFVRIGDVKLKSDLKNVYKMFRLMMKLCGFYGSYDFRLEKWNREVDGYPLGKTDKYYKITVHEKQ